MVLFRLKGFTMPKIVFNKLLNGWFIVRGVHQTPIGGRHETKQAAIDHINNVKRYYAAKPSTVNSRN